MLATWRFELSNGAHQGEDGDEHLAVEDTGVGEIDEGRDEFPTGHQVGNLSGDLGGTLARLLEQLTRQLDCALENRRSYD